ncbi:MAG TPA: hypothetical protein VGY32_02545 [Solirubrobacteraceae bacterium]|jgi:hypothetical protein|nr:hypothetical protein [Solirubrobacteraceae bacterium]
MPQIFVTADGGGEERSVMLRERINVADFESDRFAENLVERLGWAVLDAAEAEHTRDAADPEFEAPEAPQPQAKRRFERKSADDRVPQPV